MPDRRIEGAGAITVAAGREVVLAALLDPASLRRIVPGAESIDRLDDGRFRAVLRLGVGRLSGRYAAELGINPGTAPGVLELSGRSSGPLGWGHAAARVTLTGQRRGTRIAWIFDGVIGGIVTLAGQPVLTIASRLFITRFFAGLQRALGPGLSLTIAAHPAAGGAVSPGLPHRPPARPCPRRPERSP